MGQLLKKAGSLILAIGALALVLFNAAINHGCGGARSAEPAAQVPADTKADSKVAPDSEARPASEPPVGVPSAAAEADPECEERSYMHATKAPVWMAEDKCRRRAAAVKGAAEPAAESDAPSPTQQQAP